MTEEIDRIKFLNYFQTFTTFKASKYDEILTHVYNYSIQYGLEEDDMTLIATISFQQNLGFMRLRKLLKCLIPRQYCSKQTVQLILKQIVKYRFGPFLVLRQLLMWLIGVVEFNMVETNDEINNYYHLFVGFMKFQLIDVPASKLVYFFTQPGDVSRSFTQDVLKLHKKTNNARHFAALLYLFKCYRPDLVPEKIPVYSAQRSFGKITAGILNNFVSAKFRIDQNYGLNLENIWNKFGMENVTSTKGICLIPNKNVHISNEVGIRSKGPDCVLSLLNNASGMYSIIFGSKITQERLSYQLYFVLWDAFLDRNPKVSYEERKRILEKTAILQNALQQPIPVVSKFIGKYIITWDGFEHETEIYNILEWMHVKSFTEFNHCVLKYLLQIYEINPVLVKCRILVCLGNFLVNMIHTYINRELKRYGSKFLNIKPEYSFFDFIKQMYVFLEHLSLTGLLMEKNHPAILNTILVIQESIISAGDRAQINIKMSKHISYSALVSPFPHSLNAICKIMNDFPECVKPNVRRDFVDCLIHRSFSLTHKKSYFDGFNCERSPVLESSLHIENHYAFICYTYAINKDITRDEHVRILNKIKQKYINIIKFLKNHI